MVSPRETARATTRETAAGVIGQAARSMLRRVEVFPPGGTRHGRADVLCELAEGAAACPRPDPGRAGRPGRLHHRHHQEIEQDQRRPSKEIAERLAEALGLPLAERAAFVQSARGQRAADRLAVAPPPGQGVPAGARHVLSNLSVQRTRLIGRAREVAQLRALLLRDDVGLVTLTGPGGTGKTRLSAHVAAELRDAFPDGSFVVELAPITDPALLLPTIASTLQVGDRGGQPLLETLKDYLRPKQLLLVLDNFEQIVAAAAVVGELLRASPHLKVLATSRIGLRIAGEHEYPVPPLAVPDLSQLPPLEQLTAYAAVTLFLERVTAVTPGFAVTSVNAPAVAAICVRLDGLPLAIELAAARVKILAPVDLLHRLTQTVTRPADGADRRRPGPAGAAADLAQHHRLELSPARCG